MQPGDIIEILPVSLLDKNHALVSKLRFLAKKLGLDFGWHYLLDLTWIISQIDKAENLDIMDVGAGVGMMQWYLAEHGARVISVDRASRSDIPIRFRKRYHIQTISKKQPLNSPLDALIYNLQHISGLYNKFKYLSREMLGAVTFSEAPGQVVIYDCEAGQLDEIPSNSLDTVVAVSALEHNPPDQLQRVVIELMRTLKPGGKLLATLGAARDQDWFHEPSKGWNYTEASIKRIFQLPTNTPSNYSQYDELFFQLRNCRELRDNLAGFYFTSGNTGMPWGKWDPQYQIVGVCKVKAN